MLVSLVAAPVPAFADTDRVPVHATPLVSAAALVPLDSLASLQLDAKTWQEERDAALSRRRRGRILMWIGAGVTGVGVLMATTVTGDCNAFVCEYDYRVPGLMISSGAGVFVWGVMQQKDAGRTLQELERQRPARSEVLVPVVCGRARHLAARRYWRRRAADSELVKP